MPLGYFPRHRSLAGQTIVRTGRPHWRLSVGRVRLAALDEGLQACKNAMPFGVVESTTRGIPAHSCYTVAMSDDRNEVKTPNLLTPEQGRSFETETTESQEPTVPVRVAQEDEKADVAPEQPSNIVPSPKREAAAAPRPEKDPSTKAIDDILEADLEGFFDALAKNDQDRFIAEGEKLTAELVAIVHQKKPNFSHTLDRITDWLHMLPMLKKEFVRQEAKRKNDQIIMYVEAQEQRGQLAA